MEKGDYPRYIVTNLDGDAKCGYEDVYCARGEVENRIKEGGSQAKPRRLIPDEFGGTVSSAGHFSPPAHWKKSNS